MNRKGFSLIEVLVVVLIIGILAAIAMPMYQKAVERARTAEALALLKHVRDLQKMDEVSFEKTMKTFKKLERTYPQMILTASNYGNFSAYQDGQAKLNNFDYVVSDDADPRFNANIIAIKNTGPYKGYALFYYNSNLYCMENEAITSKPTCEEVFAGEPSGTFGSWTVFENH